MICHAETNPAVPDTAGVCYAVRMHIPTTSKTLLRTLGENARSARWAEFVDRYRPMMETFLATHFPALASEFDDIMQNTLLVLVRTLPNYRYSPGENGAFRSYLTGILHHKACACARVHERDARRDKIVQGDAEAPAQPDFLCSKREEAAWRESVYEVALRQLLADESIQERTKQVFIRVVMRGEPLADVAKAFGIEPNAAYQIRFRMIQRLKNTVEALEKAVSDENPA